MVMVEAVTLVTTKHRVSVTMVSTAPRPTAGAVVLGVVFMSPAWHGRSAVPSRTFGLAEPVHPLEPAHRPVRVADTLGVIGAEPADEDRANRVPKLAERRGVPSGERPVGRNVDVDEDARDARLVVEAE